MVDDLLDGLDELAQDVGIWSLEQFGEQDIRNPLLGAGEELGELKRSILKRDQGIDDSEKYADRDDVGPEAERDAVADIAIYLCDFAYRADLEFSGTSIQYFSIDEFVDAKDVAMEMGLTLGRLQSTMGAPDSETSISEAIRARNVVELLDIFCEMRGYDLEACIIDAWNDVSERTWEAS